MPLITTIIQFTPEELAADRRAVIKEAIEAYREACSKQLIKEAIETYREACPEPLIPKEKIMKVYGWGEKKFYSERRKRNVEAIEIWGNVPVYRLSDFLEATK